MLRAVPFILGAASSIQANASKSKSKSVNVLGPSSKPPSGRSKKSSLQKPIGCRSKASKGCSKSSGMTSESSANLKSN
ncbi:hypothetical protein Leryth_020858 [Lithospermum erythrorhizon]|nr:hypothetical protein Leryth_020858 [Lithospermum erythrorhizon]